MRGKSLWMGVVLLLAMSAAAAARRGGERGEQAGEDGDGAAHQAPNGTKGG